MIVVNANRVGGYWSPPPHHRELKVLLSPSLQHGVSQSLSIGMVTLPPGESGDLHAHKREQEVWFVIAGTGRLKIGDDEVELVPDTLVVAPPGTQHQIMNSGKEPLRALFMYSPAGPETSFLPSG